MSNSTDDQAQMSAAIRELTASLRRFEARYEAARRSERRLRIGLVFSTLLILGGGIYLGFIATTDFVAQIAPPRVAQIDPEAALERRAQLLASLEPAERARLEQFEAQTALVREYVQVSPEFNAGATVALVLSSMSRSVEVMPALYRVVAAMADDMRAMNARLAEMDRKMDALPVLATQVQGMRVEMAIMAASVDSTMGRAGRMLPWNW
ncbi:MAG: hypothetical protein C1943_04880 [Halochromatium sp.]|nr:hypothetical protein [Halochromatium sp.]